MEKVKLTVSQESQMEQKRGVGAHEPSSILSTQVPTSGVSSIPPAITAELKCIVGFLTVPMAKHVTSEVDLVR